MMSDFGGRVDGTECGEDLLKGAELREAAKGSVDGWCKLGRCQIVAICSARMVPGFIAQGARLDRAAELQDALRYLHSAYAERADFSHACLNCNT